MIKKFDMKKTIVGIIILCLILIANNAVFAATKLALNYDGKILNYSGAAYKITIDNKEVKTDLPGIVLNKAVMFPLRPVFEHLGGSLVWNSKTQVMDITYNGSKLQFTNNSATAKIDGKTIKLSVPAKKINERLLVPVDFFKNLKNFSFATDNKAYIIKITTKKPAETPSNAKPADNNQAAAAQTLTLNYDGKTVKYSSTKYKITLNDKEVKTDMPGLILNKVTMLPLRPVFEQLGGTVIWNSKTQVMDITYNGSKLQFTNNSATAKIDGKNVKLSAPAKKINERLMVPLDFFNNFKNLKISIDAKLSTVKISTDFMGTVKEVSSAVDGDKTIVILKMNNHKAFKYYRQTDPNRIVVDFENVKTSAEEQTVETDSELIDGINISAASDSSTRISINLTDFNNFSVETLTDGCRITIRKPLNTKLAYENNFDRVYFSIKDINLADVGMTVNNHFTEEYDPENNKYIMTIPASSSLSLAEETFNIDDSRISTVEIIRDEETKDTKIVFNTKQELKFYTTYNKTRKQTEIILLTPAKEGEVLVVIDAGHGGEDPGAGTGKIKEKDLTLPIALKLESQLKEKGIKTFMIRQDDTFVGLYDRPYIANALKATLFISVHINASDSTKASGTETLYYPEQAGDETLTGEKFASIIQDLLIKKLNTFNRKTVKRPGLVVLKYSEMPAALAEIGFISNVEEYKKLCDPDFQQKTAEALSDAVVTALERLEAEKQAGILDIKEVKDTEEIHEDIENAENAENTENTQNTQNAEGDI